MKREVRNLLNRLAIKYEDEGLKATFDEDEEAMDFYDKQLKLVNWLLENPNIAEGLHERGFI